MSEPVAGKVTMWCSAIIAAVTLVLYFGAKRDAEQALIPQDFDAAPYFITLGICGVAFIAGTIYASRSTRD